MSVFLKGKENQRIHAWYPGSLGWNEKTPQSGFKESREGKKETARGSEDKQKEKKEEEKQRDQK